MPEQSIILNNRHHEMEVYGPDSSDDEFLFVINTDNSSVWLNSDNVKDLIKFIQSHLKED